MPLQVAVNLHCRNWLQACPRVRQLARQAACAAVRAAGSAACARQAELGIVLTDDSEQRRLNRDFRGRDASTNVLSFPGAPPSARRKPEPMVPPASDSRTTAETQPPLLLGDVVLAFETVAREAAEQGRPLADRLRHLVVHGTLHLLGWDHQSEPEAEAMELLEIAILAKLGVSDPYIDTI